MIDYKLEKADIGEILAIATTAMNSGMKQLVLTVQALELAYSHSNLTEENAKLREVLELITSTSGWMTTIDFNDGSRVTELLNQLKDQNNDK